MSCIKKWSVGRRIVGLMSNGVIVIAEPEEGIVWNRDQFTLATGVPGLTALRDTLTEVIEEINNRKKISKDRAGSSAPIENTE